MRKLLVCLAAALAAAGCDNNNSTPTNPSDVNIEFSFSDLVVGTGAVEAAPGRTATITYTLWLYNQAGVESKGTRVGGSSDAGAGPFSFTIGSGNAIPGIDQGVRGMRVGGSRRIFIPARLAYGAQGQGSIPPNSALVFEVGLTNLQ